MKLYQSFSPKKSFFAERYHYHLDFSGESQKLPVPPDLGLGNIGPKWNVGLENPIPSLLNLFRP